MKAGKTLQELAAVLKRQNEAKRDFIVSTTAMNMDPSGARFALNREAQVEAFGMTGLFHRQLGKALEIPANYYDKMRSEYPHLMAINVNGWLRKAEAKHMVRTLDGDARALVSPRYRRIDNWEIAEAVLPVISGIDGARVESCDITEKRMYLKVVNPRLEKEIVPGDVVQSGIIISNSEVGLGAVSVMPLVYRLVCANGMIVSDFGTRKNHVGRELEEAWELFSDATQEADDKAFLMKLADIVRSAVDEARFGLIVEKLREATEAKITAPVASVVELTGKQYKFSAKESDGILQHLILGGDLSLYGLSNAVTRTANDMDSYERATELETAGWEIATMENRIWKELNEI